MPSKASLAQVRQGHNGQLIEIDADVLYVCDQIREISASLGVEWNERSELFRVYELGADGRKRTVFWTPELTADIPAHLRSLTKEDYAKAIEAADRQADRDREHQFHERIAPIAERMHHAIRKDKGYSKDRAFLPRGL